MPTDQTNPQQPSVADRLANPSLNKNATTELPSITGYLKSPAVKKYGTIGSLVLNLILFISLIVSASGGNQQTVTPTFVLPSTTAAPTSLTKPTPTNKPAEQGSVLRECFNNCDKQKLIDTVEAEAKKVTSVKAAILYTDLTNNNCYGDSLISSTNLEANSYHFDSLCGSQNPSLPNNTIRINGDLYIKVTSTIWERGTATPINRTKLETVVLDALQQQNIEIKEFTRGQQELKQLVGTSSQVNEFGQLVTLESKITIDGELKVLDYEINKPGVSNEKGAFYDHNIANQISAPI